MAFQQGSSAAVAMTRVVVVDDSRLMRELISAALTADGDIDVVGIAADPFEARTFIRATNPDVVSLDVEMPGMGGLEFLRRIMALRPMPVVMVSTTTTAVADTTLTALEIGAINFVAKPAKQADWAGFGQSLRDKVRTAARVKFDLGAMARGRQSGTRHACPVPVQPHVGGARMGIAGQDGGEFQRPAGLRSCGCWRLDRLGDRDQPAFGPAAGGHTAAGHRPAHAAGLYRPVLRPVGPARPGVTLPKPPTVKCWGPVPFGWRRLIGTCAWRGLTAESCAKPAMMHR